MMNGNVIRNIIIVEVVVEGVFIRFRRQNKLLLRHRNIFFFASRFGLLYIIIITPIAKTRVRAICLKRAFFVFQPFKEAVFKGRYLNLLLL
jgi:hypothetical protein